MAKETPIISIFHIPGIDALSDLFDLCEFIKDKNGDVLFFKIKNLDLYQPEWVRDLAGWIHLNQHSWFKICKFAKPTSELKLYESFW